MFFQILALLGRLPRSPSTSTLSLNLTWLSGFHFLGTTTQAPCNQNHTRTKGKDSLGMTCLGTKKPG